MRNARHQTVVVPGCLSVAGFGARVLSLGRLSTSSLVRSKIGLEGGIVVWERWEEKCVVWGLSEDGGRESLNRPADRADTQLVTLLRALQSQGHIR